MSLDEETKKRALGILERRDLSVREFKDKFIEKGGSPETAGEAALWLGELRLLDDRRYSELVVRHYAAKGFGKMRIRRELFRRGVPRELWDAALEDMPDTESTVDRLLRARLKSADPDRAELKKAAGALLRRGFSWEEIEAAIERLKTGEEDY